MTVTLHHHQIQGTCRMVTLMQTLASWRQGTMMVMRHHHLAIFRIVILTCPRDITTVMHHHHPFQAIFLEGKFIQSPLRSHPDVMIIIRHQVTFLVVFQVQVVIKAATPLTHQDQAISLGSMVTSLTQMSHHRQSHQSQNHQIRRHHRIMSSANHQRIMSSVNHMLLWDIVAGTSVHQQSINQRTSIATGPLVAREEVILHQRRHRQICHSPRLFHRRHLHGQRINGVGGQSLGTHFRHLTHRNLFCNT